MTSSGAALEEGDELPRFAFITADGSTWRTDSHRTRRVPLVLILHRHLA
jgi:hypothetical protein